MNSKKLLVANTLIMIKLNCYLLIAVGVDNKTFKLSEGEILLLMLKVKYSGGSYKHYHSTV